MHRTEHTERRHYWLFFNVFCRGIIYQSLTACVYIPYAQRTAGAKSQSSINIRKKIITSFFYFLSIHPRKNPVKLFGTRQKYGRYAMMVVINKL